MNKIYQTEQTMFVFGVMKDGKNIWKLIKRPNKIVFIINQVSGDFQVILDTDEDMTEFYTDNLHGFTMTISNDPQQDPYGEVTNLGYYSMKFHAFAGSFPDKGAFSYLTKVKMIDEKRQIKSALLRYNFPYKFPSDILGPNTAIFDNNESYMVYKLSFIDATPDMLVVDKLAIMGENAYLRKTIYDMSNCANGSQVLSNVFVPADKFNIELENMLK
jgi:hypothetical protein